MGDTRNEIKRYLLTFRIAFAKKSLSRTEHGMLPAAVGAVSWRDLVLLPFRSSGPGNVILWKQTEETLSAHHQARHHCGERIFLILCCSQIWRRGNIEVPQLPPYQPTSLSPLTRSVASFTSLSDSATRPQMNSALLLYISVHCLSISCVSASAFNWFLKAAQWECRVLDSLDWQTACFSSILWCQYICASQGHFAKFTCQKPRILFALHLCACNSVTVL